MIRQLINIVFAEPTETDDHYMMVTGQLANALASFGGDLLAMAARHNNSGHVILSIESQSVIPESTLTTIFQTSGCSQLLTMRSDINEVSVRSDEASDGSPIAPLFTADGKMLNSRNVEAWRADAAVIPIAEVSTTESMTVH